MEMWVLILIAILWIVLSIPRRTRPLGLLVVAAWLLYMACLDFFVHDDNVRAIGGLILIIGIVVNVILNRSKYIADVKGQKASSR